MLSFYSLLSSTVLLLAASHFPKATATVGVVDIDDLLHGKNQQPIGSSSSTQNGVEEPWSHDPHCVRSTNLSSVGRKFCIYTSNMTGPTGVSLIISPRTAAKISEYQFLDDNPLDNFLTRKQAEDLFSNNPPYEVREVEGKGMGVVATRKIKRFETVMVDQASVVEDLDVEKAFSKEEERRLLARAVKQLRRPLVVKELSAKHGSQGEEEEAVDEERLEADIMLTNAFGSEIAGRKCRALFPLISRINHECNPNSFVLFSRAGISMAVKAYRDIEPGEELSISYVTLGQPFPRRQDALKRWGFTCTCPLCSLPPSEKTASDVRRTLIAQAEPKIIERWEAGDHAEAITLTEESVEMIQDENLEHMLTDEYALLAKLWLLVGEREKAEELGKKSFDLLADMGFMGNDVEQLEWDLEKFLGLVGNGAM